MVSISFQELAYFIPESNPGSVSVCVNLTFEVERNVTFTVSAVEESALSE